MLHLSDLFFIEIEKLVKIFRKKADILKGCHGENIF